MLYEGKHIRRESRKKRRFQTKITVLCASLSLAVCCVIGGTLAWLTAKTEPVENKFNPAQVNCKVQEDFDSATGVKENVQIKNTSDIPAYIRVRLVGYNKDAEGHIVGDIAEWLKDIPVKINESWFKAGNYYYYKFPVEPGEFTDNLIDSCILQDGQVLEILAEAIQSQPSDTIESAWAEVKAAEDGNLTAASQL